MNLSLAFVFLWLFVSCSHTSVIPEFIYQHEDQILEGQLYLPSGNDKRPAVLVYPAWKGPNEQTAQVARELSEQGYVAMVVDMYGQGIRPKNNEEAAEQATIYRSQRPLMRARAKRALDVLSQHPRVDTQNISAIGFCFGGGVALELARDGASLVNAISFHGNLDTPNLSDAKNIKAKILVLHGAVDPLVPDQQVDQFHKEMEMAKVDYTFVGFGGAVHSFSDPNAGSDPSTGVAYNKNAAERSFEMMRSWLSNP